MDIKQLREALSQLKDQKEQTASEDKKFVRPKTTFRRFVAESKAYRLRKDEKAS